MAPKVFITSVTGYVGGSILHVIAPAHPEYEITALMRKIPTGFSEKYPAVKPLVGSFESLSLLYETASNSDIVIHAGDSDAYPAVEALLKGLASRTEKSFYIHLSGIAYLLKTFDGTLDPRVWSDTSASDLAEIRQLPDTAIHRKADSLVSSAARIFNAPNLNTAVVTPPGIYGRGLGLGKKYSILAPTLLNDIRDGLFGSRAFYFGKGESAISYVHIKDLVRVYGKLVEAAAAGGVGATWGEEGGLYFAPTYSPVKFRDIAEEAGRVLKKKRVVTEEKPAKLTIEDMKADEIGIKKYFYAGTGVSKGDRVRELWGLEASEKPLIETLEEDLVFAIEEGHKGL